MAYTTPKEEPAEQLGTMTVAMQVTYCIPMETNRVRCKVLTLHKYHALSLHEAMQTARQWREVNNDQLSAVWSTNL